VPWLPFVILLTIAVVIEAPSMVRWITERFR
jgi:hypothetical protein